MTSAFRILSEDELNRWLKTLVGSEFSPILLARYTGIPVNCFKWAIYGKGAVFSPARRMLLSKVYSERANGYLKVSKTGQGVFAKSTVERLTTPEHQPPMFHVKLTSRGPALRLELPPAMPRTLPTIRGLSLKPR